MIDSVRSLLTECLWKRKFLHMFSAATALMSTLSLNKVQKQIRKNRSYDSGVPRLHCFTVCSFQKNTIALIERSDMLGVQRFQRTEHSVHPGHSQQTTSLSQQWPDIFLRIPIGILDMFVINSCSHKQSCMTSAWLKYMICILNIKC